MLLIKSYLGAGLSAVILIFDIVGIIKIANEQKQTNSSDKQFKQDT